MNRGMKPNMKKLLVLLAVVLMATVSAQDAQEPQDPKALVKAREDHQKELKRVSDPVTKDYLQTLEKLKRELGGNGDAAGAMAVQKEIDAVGVGSKKETVPGAKPASTASAQPSPEAKSMNSAINMSSEKDVLKMFYLSKEYSKIVQNGTKLGWMGPPSYMGNSSPELGSIASRFALVGDFKIEIQADKWEVPVFTFGKVKVDYADAKVQWLAKVKESLTLQRMGDKLQCYIPPTTIFWEETLTEDAVTMEIGSRPAKAAKGFCIKSIWIKGNIVPSENQKEK